MISIYNSDRQKIPSKNVTIDTYLEWIKEGRWQDQVLAVRNKKLEKRHLEVATVSGVFDISKEEKNLVEHSGFICIDIDKKDNIAAIDKDVLAADEYTYAIHDSASGTGGVAIIVRIDPKKHKDAFDGLQKYYFEKYGIVIDSSCRNINRLRYVSYDPDLYLNNRSKTFKTYLKKVEKQVNYNTPVFVKSDFDEMVNKAAPMNLFHDYSDYIRLAFALAHEFGESGRDYFHALCSSSTKYQREESDKHYDKVLQREDASKKPVTINTIYKIFKDAGISIISERTKKIQTIAKLSDDPISDLKNEGIEVEEDLIDQFKKKDSKEEKTTIDLVVEMIKLEKIKFNEITRNFEFKGEEMNDRILAEFYSKVWTKIDDSIAKDKIFTLIQNRSNTQSYNPIHDWFDKNKNLSTSNEFEKLKQCFEIRHSFMTEQGLMAIDKQTYLDIFLKKWLISLVASAYGTYSLMILVLNGEQGTNKTKFFRNLLPPDLRQFYSESNLDEGKDSEILMTKKWLIVDDEFGGKSKKDATKLKRLSSQQTFSIRMPYGRTSEDLLRLAVLGGTSNDYEVINDLTGNRRVIPINIESFDFDKYEQIDKNKLFIELYRMWINDKEGWYLTKQEVEYLNKATLSNQEVMIEEELIIKQLEYSPYGSLTASDIVIGLTTKNIGLRTNTKRIGMCLKKLGFDNHVQKINGIPCRVYKLNFIN
jgi:predicted P-loop ATPase